MVPQALIDICEHAMGYDPESRFSNMLQMAKALQDWLDGVQQEDKARQLLMEVGSLKRQIRTLHGRSNSIEKTGGEHFKMRFVWIR